MKHTVRSKMFLSTGLAMAIVLLTSCANTQSQESYEQPGCPCRGQQNVVVDRIEVNEVVVNRGAMKSPSISQSAPGNEPRVVPVKPKKVKKPCLTQEDANKEFATRSVQPTDVKKKPEAPQTVAPTPKEKPAADVEVIETQVTTVVAETSVEKGALSQAEQEKAKLKAQMDTLKAEQERLSAEKAKVTQKLAESKACDEIKDWVATEGSTLRGLLTEWGDQAGWRVVWNMDRDYTLEAGAVFRGRFVDVSAALLRSFARARPAPKGVFYKGNKVLVISTREDENAE